MAKAPRDFTDILVRNGTISADQLEEARGLATSTGIKVTALEDHTPVPHNGCRPRKRRRV